MGHILPAGHLLARGERAQVRFSNSTSREMPWIMQLRIIATKRCLSRESRQLPLTSSRTSMQTRLNNRTRVCSARKMQGRTCTKRERKRSLRIPILRPLFSIKITHLLFVENEPYRNQWTDRFELVPIAWNDSCFFVTAIEQHLMNFDWIFDEYPHSRILYSDL